VLVAKGKCTAEQTQSGKALLHETVCLGGGLIRSISPDRLREEPAPYGIRGETVKPDPSGEQEQAREEEEEYEQEYEYEYAKANCPVG
jgi:hypothetical protein